MIRICAVIMLAAVATATGGEAWAKRMPLVDDPNGKLSATEYFSMLPFVIPLMEGKVYKKQLTLVLAIGMVDDGDRDELRRVSPRFRDAVYRLLFRLITFRTAQPRIPAKSTLERKLFPVIKKLGGDMIKSLKVHKMFVGRRH